MSAGGAETKPLTRKNGVMGRKGMSGSSRTFDLNGGLRPRYQAEAGPFDTFDGLNAYR